MKEFANIESRNRHKQKFFYSWEKGDSKTSTTLTTNKWYLKTIFVSAGNFNLAVSSSCQSGCLLHKIETIILFPVTCDFICFFFSMLICMDSKQKQPLKTCKRKMIISTTLFCSAQCTNPLGHFKTK